MVTNPIRTKEEIQLLKDYFISKGNFRNYTLFVIGINTALRISDLILLQWRDVYDLKNKEYLNHITVFEHKTKKRICIAMNDSCTSALDMFMQRYGVFEDNNYLFYSGSNKNYHISRNRAYNIIKDAAYNCGIEGNISCHSMRKTFGYHAWKNGAPPALIMEIYNHSSIEITKRYLSISQDDKDELYNAINL